MTLRQMSFLLFFLVLGLVSADNCPPLWTGYDNYCYRLFGPPKNWRSAEAHCQEFFTHKGQGHLASIHSSGEDNLLLQMSTTTGALMPDRGIIENSVWIGFSDLANEGQFTWSDGTEFGYTAWRTDQPDDGGHGVNEDCGSYWKTTDQVGWNDGICIWALPYLCKMPSN